MTSPKQYPTCDDCGSHDMRKDAWAYWDAKHQKWEFGDVYDNTDCADCGSTSITWGTTPPKGDA